MLPSRCPRPTQAPHGPPDGAEGHVVRPALPVSTVRQLLGLVAELEGVLWRARAPEVGERVLPQRAYRRLTRALEVAARRAVRRGSRVASDDLNTEEGLLLDEALARVLSHTTNMMGAIQQYRKDAAANRGLSLPPPPLPSLRDRRGRRLAYKSAMRRVVLHALAALHTSGALRSGLPLRYSDHSCDHHPQDAAHPCVALEGRLHEPGMLLPPFHPNCTHYLAVYDVE